MGTSSAPELPSPLDNVLLMAPDYFSRFATVISLTGKYITMLFIPHPLISDYSFSHLTVSKISDPLVVFWLIILSGLIIFTVAKLRHKNIYAFIILYFLITLSIYSNAFFLIGTSFAERFLYAPSLAFCVGTSFCILHVFKIDIHKTEQISFKILIRNALKPVFLILILVLFIYAPAIYSRNKEWKSNYSLFSADLKKATQSAHLHFNYACAILRPDSKNNKQNRAKLEDEAVRELKNAISIFPAYSDAYDKLATLYLARRQYADALKYFDLALKYGPFRAITNNNIGMIYFSQGKFDKAKDYYLKAIDLDSLFADAYLNLGSTYGMEQRYDEAIRYFNICLSLDPQNVTAKNYLKLCIEKKKQQ